MPSTLAVDIFLISIGATFVMIGLSVIIAIWRD